MIITLSLAALFSLSLAQYPQPIIPEDFTLDYVVSEQLSSTLRPFIWSYGKYSTKLNKVYKKIERLNFATGQRYIYSIEVDDIGAKKHYSYSPSRSPQCT